MADERSRPRRAVGTMRAGMARLARRVRRRLRMRAPLPPAPSPPRAPRTFDSTRVAAFIASGGLGDQLAYLKMPPFVAEALLQGRVTMPTWIDHADWEPPPADVVFASVLNDRYAPGFEAQSLSLLEVYPDLRNRYVVFHDGSLSQLAMDRLIEIYPRFEFQERDPQRYSVAMGEHDNHKRVGLLGYLTIDALEIETPEHVVVLDSDLLFLGDISPLWKGSGIKGVPAVGARPFVVNVRASGKPVINSGVLSFPAAERGPAAVAHARATLARVDDCDDPILVPLADQKFWNIYLTDRELVVLPQNFNVNKSLLTAHFPHELGSISILHLVGNKPWESMLHPLATGTYTSPLTGGDEPWSHLAAAVWHASYRRLALRHRLGLFRTQCAATLTSDRGTGAGRSMEVLSALSEPEDISGDPITMIRAADLVRRLPGGYRVDHVLIDHEDLGGWHTPRPVLDEALMAALTALPASTRVWAPFYFRQFLERQPALGRPVAYFLQERPLVREVATSGSATLDLMSPLADAGGPVASVAVPIAVHLGVKEVVCHPATLAAGTSDSDSPAGHAWSVVRAAAAARGLAVRVAAGST